MHSRSKMIATACGLALCLGMLPATAVVSLADDEGVEVTEAAQAPEVAEGVVDESDDADIEAYAAASDDKLNITGTFMYGYAKEQLDLMNQERKKAGVDALVMSKSLQQAAMQRAAEIAVYNSHTRPNGQVYSTLLPKDAVKYYIGENSSVGYNTASEVTEGWMKCDAREKFILSAKFKSVGIGCVQIGGVFWWVQCYGTVTTDQGYVATENRTETKVVEVSYSTVNHDTYEIRAKENDANVVKVATGSGSQLQVGILADSDYDFYTPFIATDYTWSSSNSSVASVDSNGLVKGVSGGTATITAKSKYNGRTVTKAVSVSATSLAKAKVAVSAQTFTGSALTPAPTVTLDGKALTAGKDYTVAYSNNVYPGTAKLTVTGQGQLLGHG